MELCGIDIKSWGKLTKSNPKWKTLCFTQLQTFENAKLECHNILSQNLKERHNKNTIVKDFVFVASEQEVKQDLYSIAKFIGVNNEPLYSGKILIAYV